MDTDHMARDMVTALIITAVNAIRAASASASAAVLASATARILGLDIDINPLNHSRDLWLF